MRPEPIDNRAGQGSTTRASFVAERRIVQGSLPKKFHREPKICVLQWMASMCLCPVSPLRRFEWAITLVSTCFVDALPEFISIIFIAVDDVKDRSWSFLFSVLVEMIDLSW
jgi:hypothetical protein